MRIRHNGICALALAALAGVAVTGSPALGEEAAYDNFGPNNDYNTTRGWVLRGINVGNPLNPHGFLFTAEATGDVTEFVFAVRHREGPNRFRAQLWTDDGGLPGDMLGEWDFEGAPASEVFTVEADGSVTLDEGEQYWFAIAMTDDTRGTWYQNNTDDSGPRAAGTPDWELRNPDSNKAAFRIMVEEGDPCIADWNGDGVVNINDFFAYLSDFEAGDPRADLTGSGTININDFFMYLDLFEQGC